MKPENLDKAHFLDRVSREMEEDLGVLDLPPREALAICCERMVLVDDDLHDHKWQL